LISGIEALPQGGTIIIALCCYYR